MSKEPLLTRIKNSCVDGVLPTDFSLSADKKSENKIHFVDGAMDGISMYHMSHSALDESENKKMIEIINMISDGKKDDVCDKLIEFTQNHSAISIIDAFENYILQNKNHLNASNLYQYGVYLITYGTNTECVKVGMEILELFSLSEEIKDDIRTLGLSNEFTLFTIFNMLTWDNANDEIFRLAKKVTGWGRIHAIERIRAETEEIKDWLLREGTKNNILPEYSALDCFYKSEAAARLKMQISNEDFQAVGNLLNCMLLGNGGPVSGISDVENVHEVLTDYLVAAKNHSLELSDYEVIKNIYFYVTSDDNSDKAVEEICLEILKSSECAETVKSAITKGDGYDLADMLNIDYKNALLKCLSINFDKAYVEIRYLMNDAAYIDRVIPIIEDKIPLDKIATGSADSMGFGKEFAEHRKLSYCVHFLKPYVGKGERLLITALNSPVIDNRNMALTVLDEWTEKNSVNLKEISPRMYEELKKVVHSEVRDDVRKRMEKLL